MFAHGKARYMTASHSGEGGGPRVVVSTAAFHARVRGSVPGLGGLKETKLFLPHPRVKVTIVGSLRDREVACSASDRQGSNFESCVWRTVSSQSSHHPQEVLLAQFSLYVHKGGLKPDSFHFPQWGAPQQARHFDQIHMLFHCWANVVDDGPTLKQQMDLLNISWNNILSMRCVSLSFCKITNWPSVVLSLCHRYHVGSAINQPWVNVWKGVVSCYLFAPDTITQDTSSVPALLPSIPEKKQSHKNPLAIIDSAPSAIFQFCWYLPVNRPIKSKWMLQISINGG